MTSQNATSPPPANPDKSSGPKLPKLGIIISMFPELHETFILRELAALERAGVEFEIYSLQRPRDPVTLTDAKRLMQQRSHYAGLLSPAALSAFAATLFTQPLRLGCAVLRLIGVGWRQPLELIKCLAILPLSLHFARLAKRDGVEHLHGHWANIPTTACWFLQQIKGFSWSAAIHGEDIFSPNPILSYKLAAARFTVVCSGYFCQHLKNGIGHPRPEDIHCNYHGLEPLVWQRSAEYLNQNRPASERVKLLSIGRLVPTKGHAHLINACATLDTDQWQLEIIGSGPEQARLQAQIDALGLHEQITLSGPRDFDQVLHTLGEADVFCLPAKMLPGHPPDGIPNVLAEAMAFAKPVISTDMGAIPELISHEQDGLLVPPADEQRLAQALASLVGSKALRQQLGQAARDKVAKRFNQQENIDQLLALFAHYTLDPQQPRP